MLKFLLQKTLLLLTISILVSSCKQNEEARRPISRKSGSFLKESKERNAKILAKEMKQIDSLVQKNPNKKFSISPNGFLFHIDSTKTTDTIRVKKGWIAQYTAKVYNIDNTLIYDEVAFGIKNYKVEKEDLLIGLRHALQLLRKGDKGTFYFPSQIAYGYYGDKNKIGINVPLKYEVTLLDLMPETKK
jgi:gliding motility-associated peptidyl-prolyl isomerase